MKFQCFSSCSVQDRLVSSLRTISLLLPALVVVSCAGDPARSASVGEECEYVKVTGSNLPVKQCSTAAEREALAAAEREAAEQGLRNLRNLDEFGVESVGAESLY